MTIKQIIQSLEERLPLWMQEEYDNSGLQVGDPSQEATGVLLCVDITEEVIYEAVQLRCNLIISHHPLLFKGLKQIGIDSYIERCVTLAIKADICIYAAHTNADNAPDGLNAYLAKDLGLHSVRPLVPLVGKLMELVTYVPHEAVNQVQEAIWSAGAGRIGSYDQCSFTVEGLGSFRPLNGATPYVGKLNELHHQPEVRVSAILTEANCSRVISALREAHPYETPAYSLINLSNSYSGAGSGIIGDMVEGVELEIFLQSIKDYFHTAKLSYSTLGQYEESRLVRRIAICSGAGAFLWRDARTLGADVFITGEAKYNDYFDVEANPILVTVGHYESEVIATKVFRDIISHNFPTFAVYESKLNSNPIKSI